MISFSNFWDYFPCYVDGHLHTVRFDVQVEHLDLVTRARYPHIFELVISAMIVDTQGFPASVELDRISRLEESFNPHPFNMRLIGGITGSGMVRYAFAVDSVDVNGMTDALLGEEFADMKHSTHLFRNNNFEYYYDLLLPNTQERAWIANRDICADFKAKGEAFKTSRNIEFYLNFATEQFVPLVLQLLIALGADEFRQEVTPDGEFRVRMTIAGIPTFAWISNITNGILAALEGTDGYFDGWNTNVHKH